ncbi:MAG: YqaA family protein [Chitinophagales bacterium]
MDWLQWGYWGLFLSSFLSATVLPFSSEAVLAGILAAGANPFISVTVATMGNWLGGMTSYGLGYLGKWNWIEKYLRIKQEKVMKWQPKIARYGSFFAILSFLPIIGDVIVLALGFFKSHIWLSAFWMFLGKLLRYLLIMGGFQLF